MIETPSRILVVDDEPSITEFVSYALRKEGYDADVVDNGEEAFALASANNYDLFVLDIMLPGMDGYELCRRLRSKTTAPVLFLSARDTELDKVVGLEIGGDDYLAKPFSYSELSARVKALLRRYCVYGAKQGETAGLIRCCDNVEIDPSRCQVLVDGREVILTDTEYRILHLLASNRKKIFSAQNIYESIWNEPYFYTSNNTVMVHIRNLRRKLGDDPQNCRTIRTVWGRGYRIE